MKCPKCGEDLRRSKKDPNYGLCDNCKKKYKWVDDYEEDYEEDKDYIEPKPARRKAKSSSNVKSHSSHMKKKSGHLKWILLFVLIFLIAAGICFWYLRIKKPHDEAVSRFIAAANQVNTINADLDNTISSAQSVLNANEPAYDQAAINNLTVAVSEAEQGKRIVPEIPEKTTDITTATEKMLEPLDYSSFITNINEKKSALEHSIKQMKQITNPSEDFVVLRLQGIEGISACQTVTEEHDPNGMLNKQGGYTAVVYFSSPWINQDEVYGNDIVEKGTECGGGIEVYASVDDAENRNAYLASFDGAGMLNPGSHTVLGTIVIRTSSLLTATQQNELTQVISSKLLEIQE